MFLLVARWSSVHLPPPPMNTGLNPINTHGGSQRSRGSFPSPPGPPPENRVLGGGAGYGQNKRYPPSRGLCVAVAMVPQCDRSNSLRLTPSRGPVAVMCDVMCAVHGCLPRRLGRPHPFKPPKVVFLPVPTLSAHSFLSSSWCIHFPLWWSKPPSHWKHLSLWRTAASWGGGGGAHFFGCSRRTAAFGGGGCLLVGTLLRSRASVGRGVTELLSLHPERRYFDESQTAKPNCQEPAAPSCRLHFVHGLGQAVESWGNETTPR